MDNNPNLSRIIQVSQCDIDFWSRQLCEHVLFISKLLNPQVVPYLVDEAKSLYRHWYDLVNEDSIVYSPKHIAHLYAFLEHVHDKINHNHPIYIELSRDDFHALVRHMIFEQTYFVRLVEGKMTVKEELLFWLQENAEHTALISNLLPCGDIQDQTMEIANILQRVKVMAGHDPAYFADELELLRSSDMAAVLIHGFVHSGQIKSIDDAMLEHEMREAQKGEERVKFLVELLMAKQ